MLDENLASFLYLYTQKVRGINTIILKKGLFNTFTSKLLNEKMNFMKKNTKNVFTKVIP